jgi:UDPglucose 6-dehydrogenase
MVELGHQVVGIDIDVNRIALLTQGEAPFYEPGLQGILTSALSTGRLTFSSDIASAEGSSVHFVTVGTPQRAGSNAADLQFVEAALAALIPHLHDGDLIVGKSTVPIGTAARLATTVEESSAATLAWNPEFLREGLAVSDTIHPDRLVYGVPPGQPGYRAVSILNEVYSAAVAAGTPTVVTDYATAELVKVSANAFLATKISFINAMAEIAEATGADVTQLADAIGFDERIGRKFLNAGVGFGGGCLPKDIRAFRARAEELGVGDSLAFLRNVDEINLRRRHKPVDLVQEELGSVANRKIAVLGLSFKPESDDIRDSPALDVAVSLYGKGANVFAADPQAIANSRVKHPQLRYADTATEALEDAEAVILVTEWREYRELDPIAIGSLVKNRLIIDGRNVLDAVEWRAAGWTYRGLGRP